MRFQKWLLVSGLMLTAAFALVIIGCDSDDTATGTVSDPVEGALDDPGFLAVQSQVDAFADSLVAFVGHGLNTLQGIDATVLPPQYTVEPGDGQAGVQTDYANGWHVVDLVILQAAYSASVYDSIQFVKNGVPRQSPYALDQMNFVHRWDNMDLTGNPLDTTDGRANLQFSNFYATNTMISGAASLDFSSRYDYNDSVVTRNYDFAVTVSNFELDQTGRPDWFNGFQDCSTCPAEGTFEATIQMTYTKDSQAGVTTSWDVDGSFDDGVLTVHVENDDYYWDYDVTVCENN